MTSFRVRTILLAYPILFLLAMAICAQGFSTCQSFDLNDYKSKRIEAVRGQILSKLRIREPPEREVTPPPEEVPLEVMLLYNSTKEFAKVDPACERESSEEDYYAKEVQRVDMLPPRIDTSK